MRFRSLAIAAVTVPLLFGACSKTTSKDTKAAETIAAESAADTPAATEPAATEAAKTEAAAAETTAAAPATEAAAPTGSEAAMGSDAMAAMGSDAMGGEAMQKLLVSGMIKQFNGGKEPSEKDVACLTKAVSAEDMTAMSGADKEAQKKAGVALIRGVFNCKPEGVAASLASSLDKESKTSATTEQKTCIAEGMLDVMAADDALLELAMGGGDLPADQKKALTEKLKPSVEKCVTDPKVRDAILADMAK
jgi:hypothetical protein